MRLLTNPYMHALAVFAVMFMLVWFEAPWYTVWWPALILIVLPPSMDPAIRIKEEQYDRERRRAEDRTAAGARDMASETGETDERR